MDTSRFGEFLAKLYELAAKDFSFNKNTRAEEESPFDSNVLTVISVKFLPTFIIITAANNLVMIVLKREKLENWHDIIQNFTISD